MWDRLILSCLLALAYAIIGGALVWVGLDIWEGR
jgi:hypothetical protein